MHSGQGLLIVCGLNLVIFTIVFLLGWLASRATTDELLLPWRPGWWVVPLGVGYSIAIRFAAAIAIFVVIAFLVATHVFTPASAQQFMVTNRPDVEKLV